MQRLLVDHPFRQYIKHIKGIPRVHLKPKRRKANHMSHKQSQIHRKRKITDPLERTNKIREKIIEETHIRELVSADRQPKEMDMTKRTEITLGKAVPLKAIPINQWLGGGREIENLY
jgi:hypothetical protein